jgi:hypothetical protein
VVWEGLRSLPVSRLILTQHQFGEQNFQIGPLNRPDFLNNFQSQITADQSLYDAGQTRHAVRSAELMKDMTGEEGRRTQMEVIAGVTRSYYDTLLGVEQLNAASQVGRVAKTTSLPRMVAFTGVETNIGERVPRMGGLFPLIELKFNFVFRRG